MRKFPHQSTFFLQQNIEFEQWLQKVDHLRKALSLSPQQNWLLFEQDSYLFSIFFFALLAAKKRVVLPPGGQVMQIKHCMTDAEILLSSEKYPNILQFDWQSEKQSLDSRVNVQVNEQRLSAVSDSLEFSPDTQIIFFTSGSTGQPKAITKTFGQLILEVETIEKTFGAQLENAPFEPNTIVMATVSHQHIYGLLFKLLWPIWCGRDVDLRTFEYPEHLVHQIKQFPNRPVCLISSPAYYHRLIKDNVLSEVKHQLQAIFSSGGPLNPDAAIQLQEQLGVSPIEVFGSTETGGIGWRQKQSKTDELWQVFAQIDCRYVENSSRLAVRSPYLDPQQWYETDDQVTLVDNQRFKLLGRADRIVKIEEKRCSLDEIQHYLLQHEWVENAYVTTIGGKDSQRFSLAAVVELNEIGRAQLANEQKFKFDRRLKAHLKNYVEALVVPRKFRYLEQLPYNSQGKLNKKQMEALFD